MARARRPAGAAAAAGPPGPTRSKTTARNRPSRRDQSTGSAPAIVVVGSLNMDLVVRLRRLPAPGETVSGGRFARFPGGKGANQAVAAARAGGRVGMVGCTGADDFGQELRRNLAAAGVDGRWVSTDSGGESTGIALISVDEAGQNAIAVAPGANRLLTPQRIEAAAPLILAARVVLVQLEIPVETVLHVCRLARAGGAQVILDPAPVPPAAGADPLPDDLYSLVDFITPNQSEATALTGLAVDGVTAAAEAGQALVQRGVGVAVVKLGSGGAVVVDGSTGGTRHLPAFAVPAVDTTAAGDAFAGALAVALAEGKPLVDALVFASAAGALAVTRPGAQSSLPFRHEIEQLLARPAGGLQPG